LGRACVEANIKSKNFIDITRKANYKEGKLYAYADCI